MELENRDSRKAKKLLLSFAFSIIFITRPRLLKAPSFTTVLLRNLYEYQKDLGNEFLANCRSHRHFYCGRELHADTLELAE
jgi:hypothetical protein